MTSPKKRGWLLRFFLHPFWYYPIRDIVRCVREDSSCEGTRAELSDIVWLCRNYANRPDVFHSMTPRQQYLVRQISPKSSFAFSKTANQRRAVSSP
jgi:hypothetical protein